MGGGARLRLEPKQLLLRRRRHRRFCHSLGSVQVAVTVTVRACMRVPRRLVLVVPSQLVHLLIFLTTKSRPARKELRSHACAIQAPYLTIRLVLHPPW